MEQPIERRTAATSQSRTLDRASLPGQVVLVLQGGGALGSYQAGVYQALQEAGVEPDWIVGTSIGDDQRQPDLRKRAGASAGAPH